MVEAFAICGCIVEAQQLLPAIGAVIAAPGVVGKLAAQVHQLHPQGVDALPVSQLTLRCQKPGALALLAFGRQINRAELKQGAFRAFPSHCLRSDDLIVLDPIFQFISQQGQIGLTIEVGLGAQIPQWDVEAWRFEAAG